MMKKIQIVVSGPQGYVGNTLIEWIQNHPHLNLAGVHSRKNKAQLYALSPSLARLNAAVYTTDDLLAGAGNIDVIALATPAAVSMELVSELTGTNINIIDMSGAFRLPAALFEKWYGIAHTASQYIDKACYGLVPWQDNQSQYELIANPGCYASCALLSLFPLIKSDIINTDSIIIDAKSGISGAGKQTNANLMFCEAAGNYFPYKVGKHQHTPEIENALHKLDGSRSNIRLNTSILPVIRGIAMTLYTEATSSFATDNIIVEAIEDALQTAYGDYPLLHFGELYKDSPESDHYLLSLNKVVHTPNTHLAYFVQDGKITLFACIDNLLKGAASQAIENINAIYHLPLHTGLIPAGRAV